MEIKQIKYFLTVVESGSIGKAAQKLDVGASAISQQISKLEQELSIRLLQRNAFGVTPTPAGLAFLKHSQLILRQVNFAIDAAHSARLSGHVSLGFPPTITALIGIPLMKLMSERYPDIRLEIVETLSGNLIQSINSRQLDIAIIFTNEIDKQWSIQPLVREQMYSQTTLLFIQDSKKTRNNSSTESINHSLRLRLTHAHICSIGFKSGLYAGSQRILCPCCSNNS
ncbi:hypothetical protein OCUAc18_07350 [Acinetobacter baumannii]|nr:hypothetical protein OCUAc18_07350 [Acinetobacter baumannii]